MCACVSFGLVSRVHAFRRHGKHVRARMRSSKTMRIVLRGYSFARSLPYSNLWTLPRGVWTSLESVDVQLPDERAQVIVLEVEREHVLRMFAALALTPEDVQIPLPVLAMMCAAAAASSPAAWIRSSSRACMLCCSLAFASAVSARFVETSSLFRTSRSSVHTVMAGTGMASYELVGPRSYATS